MKIALLIILKDLKRRIKDPFAIILLMAFPLILSLIIGLAFGPMASGGLPTTEILIADLDEGFFSNFIKRAFTQGGEGAPQIELRDVGEEEGRDAIASGDGSALLIIPAGFTDDFFDGKQAQLTLLKNPSQTILPEVAEQYTDFLALLASYVSRFFNEELGMMRKFGEMETLAPKLEWASFGEGIYDKFKIVEKYLFPVPISIEEKKEGEEAKEAAAKKEGVGKENEEDKEEGFNIFGFVLPGLAVFGIFFIAQVVFRDILSERASGTLARLFSSPATAGAFLVGKAAGGFIISLCALLLLQIIGVLVFGMRWGPIGPLLVLDVVAIIGISGICLFVFSLAKTQNQGDSILSVIVMFMALFGGSMIPLDQLPRLFATISNCTLNAHVIKGFRAIMDTGSLSSVLPSLAVILAGGVAGVLAGVFLLRRGILRGV